MNIFRSTINREIIEKIQGEITKDPGTHIHWCHTIGRTSSLSLYLHCCFNVHINEQTETDTRDCQELSPTKVVRRIHRLRYLMKISSISRLTWDDTGVSCMDASIQIIGTYSFRVDTATPPPPPPPPPLLLLLLRKRIHRPRSTIWKTCLKFTCKKESWVSTKFSTSPRSRSFALCVFFIRAHGMGTKDRAVDGLWRLPLLLLFLYGCCCCLLLSALLAQVWCLNPRYQAVRLRKIFDAGIKIRGTKKSISCMTWSVVRAVKTAGLNRGET